MEEIQIPKKSQVPKSSEVVASIDDLLIQILLRLPVISLLNFKLVSKHWHSLISNPNFRHRHILNPNPAIGIFLPNQKFRNNPFVDFVPYIPKNSPTFAPFREPSFVNDHFGTKILQSCNGLLLLCCSVKKDLSESERIYVCNPTTKEFSTLPNLEGDAKICGMGLAFDPAKSPHYVVVCVREGSPIEKYSSETRVWRPTGEPFTGVVDFGNPVYWNGAVHWMGESFENGDALYFNVHHHVLQKMPNLPAHEAEYTSYYYFGESCDHLHYAHTYDEQLQFNVYEMKRDYSEWFVKYRVDLSPVLVVYRQMIIATSRLKDWCSYFYSIFSIVRDEEDGGFLVLQIPGRVIRYNLIPKTFEELHEFYREIARDPLANGFQYIESLCCV